MDAAAQVLHKELRFIENAVASGDREQLLKSLDERGTAEELVEREYGGRYVFELLQNANDAAGAKGVTNVEHRVAITITEHSLLFANEGQGFEAENVRSICTLGRSSKDPRKTLGYKGLGFKAVGELTEQPQVISPPYRFGFSMERARREVSKLVGSLPPGQRLPRYAFPFALSERSTGRDADQVAALLADGFVTVIRLPFGPGVNCEKVLKQVRSAIVPELLLFLDATTDIAIRWPEGSSRICRRSIEHRGTGILLEVGKAEMPAQRWLVFRSEPIHLPNTRLVESLDRSWHRVRRVSAMIAFPLDGDLLAVEQPDRAMTVYFPTQSRSGHSFIINSDFYLDLDRRHISDTPQTRPYNEWLAERVATFFGRVALPELSRLYPSDHRVVHACAPAGAPSGFGEVMSTLVRKALERTRFVPTSGEPVTPRAALRSPVPRGSATAFHHFFDRQGLGSAGDSLVHVDVENDRRADKLVEDLGAQEVPDEVVLRYLSRAPKVDADDLADFYALLGRWVTHHDSESRRAPLRAELKRRPLLRTFDDRWARATEPAFFARTRGLTDIPEGFPGNILHSDCTAGRTDAQRFLEDLGVQLFRWREVILSSLLPILRGKPTDRQIEAAHQFLRTYYAEERGGDQDVAAQIGVVPVRARAVRKRVWKWQPADKTYFSREWLGHSDIEDLYGLLGRQEFLAEHAHEDLETRASDRAYFAWLGVAEAPRALDFESQIAQGSNVWRPDGADARRWRTYAQSLDEHVADPQGHPLSQRLRTHVLDRLDGLLLDPSPKQGQALLRLLAAHWESYGPMLHGDIRCTAGQHRGERSRVVRSYADYVLRTSDWVPARIGKEIFPLAPRKVWLTGAEAPRRLGQLLPQIAIEAYPPEVQLLANALGFVKPESASVEDYANLVELVPRVLPLPPPQTIKRPRQRRLYEDQTVDLARWIMRNLNNTLAERGDRSTTLRSTPLLATQDKEAAFATNPVVIDDVRLARRLNDRFVWFHGDRGWSWLIAAYRLRRITGIASVEPVPGDPMDPQTQELTKRVEQAMPYLLALVEFEAPSEVAASRGRLGRFNLSVVEHLTLRVSIRDVVPDELHLDDEAYLRLTHLPGQGAIRAAMATYYCTPSAMHDFYRLGGGLADFVDRPALGDAFSIVLRSGKDERLRFLTAKGIDASRVKAMRDLLGRPDEQEDDDEVIVPGRNRPLGGGSAPGQAGTTQGQEKGRGGRQGGNDRRDGDGGERREEPPLPPLDSANLSVIDARNGTLRTHKTGDSGGGGSGGGGGGSRHPNWEELEAKRRRYGRRGEQAVHDAERNRLKEARLNPDDVRWIADDDETADHDFESVDEDGQIIYIEVKSTDSEDPGEPFPIASKQLRFAARHRHRYYIYRVTRVRDAVPIITRYRDPIGLWQDGRADTEVTQARMWLARQEGEP